MAPLSVFLFLTVAWLAYLAVERIRLSQHQQSVALRIAVTGTRGKTTVARRLAAVLREDGRIVMAKTTGSEAAYILPDGSVQEIRRLGLPSIIEQKRLLRRASKLGADVVVAEVMSLHPENHRVEAQQLLKPHLVLVTNFRVDHSDAQGKTRGEVARVLALDVPPGVRALVPDAEWEPDFQEAVEGEGGEVVRVPPGTHEGLENLPRATGLGEFGPNTDLVWHAAKTLGIRDEVISKGIAKVHDDVGALRGWRYRHEGSQDPWLLVNAFAANDPESTLHVFRRVTKSLGTPAGECVGILNLRSDRGDRSLQWIEALKGDGVLSFRKLFLVGFHAPAVRHQLRGQPRVGGIEILRPAGPEGMMDQIVAGAGGGGGLLMGMGNMAGVGRVLVKHWQKVGESHGI